MTDTRDAFNLGRFNWIKPMNPAYPPGAASHREEALAGHPGRRAVRDHRFARRPVRPAFWMAANLLPRPGLILVLGLSAAIATWVIGELL